MPVLVRTWKSVRIFICLILMASTELRADLFGGDVAVLAQLLANAVQQLTQLQRLAGVGQDHFKLMQDVHKGLNDALGIMRTMDMGSDPGLYRDWQHAEGALQRLHDIYGLPQPSRDERVQRDSDTSASEAIALNNSLYRYAKDLDQIGENIKRHGQNASPGGAQKVTAEALGVIVHVLNQGLRAQATGLKLQAQAMAISNKKDKETVEHFRSSYDVLEKDLRASRRFFRYPKF